MLQTNLESRDVYKRQLLLLPAQLVLSLLLLAAELVLPLPLHPAQLLLLHRGGDLVLTVVSTLGGEHLGQHLSLIHI